MYMKSRISTITVPKCRSAQKFKGDDSGGHIQDTSEIMSKSSQNSSFSDSDSKASWRSAWLYTQTIHDNKN